MVGIKEQTSVSNEKGAAPKAFISYSWSSPEHQKWVLDLAERLVSDGVDVVLDKYELREGQDKYAFMERMVTDEHVSKVLAICDRQYVEKANERKGGAGTESQIISKEVYDRVDQTKFIAIVVEYDENGKEYVPTFFSGRIFIDMSTEEKLLENYDQLLRAIYNKPLHAKPTLGKPPAHLFEAAATPSKTSHKLAAIKRAVFEDKSSVHGLITDYLRSFSLALEDFRIGGEITNDYDEQVISSIENFLPYRDEFIEFTSYIAMYRDDERTYQSIVEFFQGLLKYLHPPKNINQWNEVWHDNYRFILFELFLYQMASLIKSQRFEMAILFLAQAYFDAYESRGGRSIVAYGIFDQYPESIERMRKQRLGIRLYYLTADLLRKRAYHEDLNFDMLLQTDFILFLRSALNPSTKYWDCWTARTAGYAESYGVFEIFAKATARSYFKKLMPLLNVQSKEDLEIKYKAAVENGTISRSQHMRHIHTKSLINLEQLDTYE